MVCGGETSPCVSPVLAYSAHVRFMSFRLAYSVRACIRWDQLITQYDHLTHNDHDDRDDEDDDAK